jgi:hypothetical protein
MSELIKRNSDCTNRGKFLTGASALVLVAHITSTSAAIAEEADRPTVWIELGGQMEAVQGLDAPFSAPFMSAIEPAPDVYANDIFSHNQKPARFSFGLNGSVSIRPQDSDWEFAASIRYGRSNTSRHEHNQGPSASNVIGNFVAPKYAAPFADTKSHSSEQHAVIDFSAGRDVGLGALGKDGRSNIDIGVRFAQFSAQSHVTASGRPVVNLVQAGFFHLPTFYNYTMFAEATRSFRGIGPSLSWTASAALIGSDQVGELTLDWGVNGSLLFGRQKAQTSHTTQAYHLPLTTNPNYVGLYYTRIYNHPHNTARSHSVAVPNVGGMIGLSARYPNAKVSLGYRADFFIGAMDVGIDSPRSKTLGFHGPFATISIGFP